MIERTFIQQKTKEYYLTKYIQNRLTNVGISSIKLKKIPLGEKIIINTSRPSLVVGSKGANIKDLTKALKREFKLENPQIEINEVRDPFLDAQIVAEKIAGSLERFGSARFKAIGHKMMENVINAGALGVEIVLSGKLPSARAKSWRFYQGYLKKCGEIALTGVRRSGTTALLKSGVIGIKVSIMPPDVVLPDQVKILDEPETAGQEKTGGEEGKVGGEESIGKPEGSDAAAPKKKPRKSPRKRAPRKSKAGPAVEQPAQEKTQKETQGEAESAAEPATEVRAPEEPVREAAPLADEKKDGGILETSPETSP